MSSVSTPPHATIHYMDEGKRLLDVLTKHGKIPADFARACDISDGAVTRHIQSELFGDRAWKKTIRPGLISLGINPAEVRTETSVTSTPTGPLIDLRPLVRDWHPSNFAVLRQILNANEASRAALLYWLDGRLDPKK